ncbi:hypothetical protein A3D71_02365 [Candidatus Kaiserbacteria bacterium RIFCSPHIGHO2_02_FULL_55_20]|uniref:Transcription regulator TrmB N-terminal domain-containing protein n=1 Tax=Candidatus Kaiserbacteria bacterium RIFCSPHIGHO2_02_FULL_55_20 TaxID=1798497 RepID=A0A1F6DY43_9BACT|nr:MAG: hypothetical protein A2680_04030 [Candidatus Kaiserbacteria bacterium RIFCSPHIGHO2_01_FULL_55_37]OGG66364.1 MAG: hypothetical protein A3D71_02365 [Candidatus Kaiserbacteria bacterium RIFCSPHIGHO2_02_FULL_55_20]
MPKDIQKTLAQLGFKETEAQIYLLCLQNKQGFFVFEIAKQTGIKRSTVNLVLERLSQKGVLTHHIDGARKRFIAESPETLLFRFEDSLNDMRALIPLLHAVSGQDKKTKIRFFEGKRGIETIHHDILLTLRTAKGPKREDLAIASGENVFELQPEHQKQFIDKRVKARIPIRWIAPESPLTRKIDTLSSAEYRKMKFFDPKKYKFNIELDVYGDSVALMILGNEPAGVIVENETLAESFRGLFNLLWNSLR